MHQRMWLHALSDTAVYSGADVENSVTALSDNLFWGVQYQREVMRLLTLRWNDMTEAVRDAVELRVVAGDPR